jgi:hypothetical protein
MYTRIKSNTIQISTTRPSRHGNRNFRIDKARADAFAGMIEQGKHVSCDRNSDGMARHGWSYSHVANDAIGLLLNHCLDLPSRSARVSLRAWLSAPAADDAY